MSKVYTIWLKLFQHPVIFARYS